MVYEEGVPFCLSDEEVMLLHEIRKMRESGLEGEGRVR
jgi:hypothetical protein